MDPDPVTEEESRVRLRSVALADALTRSESLGVYVVDRDGRLVEMNPAAERILGCSARELHGLDMHGAIHTPSGENPEASREASELLRVLRSGDPGVVDAATFFGRGGVPVAVAYTSSAILGDGGEVTGAVVVFHDVSAASALPRVREELLERQRASAESLQRNLLPGALPSTARLSIAASFRPAGDEALLGGDFYDAFACDDGHIVLVGDVCGKGPEAAAVGAMLRFLLRGACRSRADLGAAVSLVNDELRAHAARRFCTLVLTHVIEHEGGLRAVLARAGHEYPVLIRRDGSAQEVRPEGMLLGVSPSVDLELAEVLLADGDALVLFTDGLTEQGRGGRRLDALELLKDLPAESSAQKILTELEYRAGLLDGRESEDDVAIVVIRVGAKDAEEDAAPAPSGDVPGEAGAIAGVEVEFREINERVNDGRPDDEEMVSVICECAHTSCEELIDIPRARYEATRESDRAFFILPDHEIPLVEHVLQRTERFWVVLKTGEAGAEAERQAKMSRQ